MGHFKDSTVYQIYTKSFQDTTGNGLGDIRGVISRLDYLKELGIDYIWLTPFFTAPVVKLNIDAMKADAENITPLQIAGTVSAMLGGKEATTLNVDGDDVSVMVE